MEWVDNLQRAIDYIEEHLEDEIDYNEIARRAYSSSFHFQRVFHVISGYTIGEYIRSRRLTRCSARAHGRRQSRRSPSAGRTRCTRR